MIQQQIKNNNFKVFLNIPLNNRTARVEMTPDEWRMVCLEIEKRTKNPQLEKNKEKINLSLLLYGKRANLALSEKEFITLHNIILEFNDDNPKKISDSVSFNTKIQKRDAHVKMNKCEFVRWLCLVESISLIEEKCADMKVRMSDDFWIQPIAIQKYMDSRYETMLDEVNHNEFGIDTKHANLYILNKKKQFDDVDESAEEVEEIEVVDQAQLSCTS